MKGGSEMSLAKKLTELSPPSVGLPCGVDKTLKVLNEEDRKALEAIMDSPVVRGGVSNRQIHEILLAEGYDVAFASVRVHRSKQCRCFVGRDSELRKAIRQKAEV
jgi:hypothetical protein